MQVKVLLLRDVNNLGKAGEIKQVKRGYAVNYLIPQGLARVATPADVAEHERRLKLKQQNAKRKQKILQDIKAFVEKKLVNKPVQIKVKTSEGGRVYGSVTEEDVKIAIVRRIPQLAVFDEKELSVELPGKMEYIGKYAVDLKVKAKLGDKTIEETIPVFVDIVSISRAHLKTEKKEQESSEDKRE